ncbi:LOW QUALITY PROTEIN: phage-like element PBSX protein XkdK [Geomicrobium sp. JCM 19039]|nr:LOW QUALITY PROTEIN: phage-like element PBSX protein XkdK [Geomicrobium sp. JCM 19039]
MNGGTFAPGVEKERAGIYFRFTSAANDRLSVGERGTVALPLELSWGAPKTFVEINGPDDVLKKYGLSVNDSSVLLLKEAMKRSQTVLAYRVNEGSKAETVIGESSGGGGSDGDDEEEGASGQSNGLRAVAKFGGMKGNDIQIRVSENVLDSELFDVTTYLNNVAVNRQSVRRSSELQDNDWVSFEGSGRLQETAGTNLSGGTNSEARTWDYTDFLSAAEHVSYDTIGLPVDDEDQLKTTFVSFVKRMRDETGIKITGVLPNFDGDHEGIINVTSSVELAERKLNVAETVAWVAGASAGATINQSLTFVDYEGAIGVNEDLDDDEIKERLRNGEFLFHYDPRDRTVSVEKDINSFTSFTAEKNYRFSKNLIVRVLDAINNDITRELKALIKLRKDRGQDIPGSNDGKQIIRSLITVYLNALQEGGAIKNFDPSDDIDIVLTDQEDGFIINLGAQPVDAAEKFYFDTEVR